MHSKPERCAHQSCVIKDAMIAQFCVVKLCVLLHGDVFESIIAKIWLDIYICITTRSGGIFLFKNALKK